jgi:hypothetical protein
MSCVTINFTNAPLLGNDSFRIRIGDQMLYVVYMISVFISKSAIFFLLSVLLNMFYAPMGIFHLESTLELPLFSGFTVVPFNCPNKTTEGTSTPNKTCRRCRKNDKRLTGKNTTFEWDNGET